MIVMQKAVKAVLSLFQAKQLIPAESAWNYLNNFSDEQYQPINVDTPMMHSMYNITKHKGRTYLLYNTLFNSMIAMSDSEYHQYDTIQFSDLSLVETLVDNGFLLPAYTKEYQRYEYYQSILNQQYEEYPHYTLALTSRCNARCIYCYEEGIPQDDMSLDTAQKFADLLCAADKPVDLTWFGGEPLLKADLIQYITESLRQNNIQYDSGIITNGSLLTEQMITEQFPAWGISWVQISIDGMKDEYLRRKYYYNSKPEIFDNLVSNIECLTNQKIPVSIRLNMDADNAEECVRVADYLKQRFQGTNMLLAYPAFLAGGTFGIEDEKKRLRYSSQVFQIFPPENTLLTNIPKINSCYFQQMNAFVVDTDGSILCCERDIGKRRTKIASLHDVYTLDELQKPISLFPKTRKQCQVCAYYPKCLGGCIASHESACRYDACFMEKYKVDYLLNRLFDF